MELYLKIENLIDKNATEFEIAKLIKSEYKLYINTLQDQFRKSSGKNFLVKHTKRVDQFLQIIYKYIIRKYFEEFFSGINSLPITLVALGSYSREELSLYSDIDLMIVYKDIKGYNTKEIIQSLLSMAWDSGFKLSHRVHELSDLVNASREDHSIKTAMIEARYIIGSRLLWIETQNRISFIKKDNQKEFIQAKLDEYYYRHDNHDIKLRANIKNSAGGLRDYNTLYWIANSLYNIKKSEELREFFDEEDYAKMMRSVDYLFKVRVALHLISRRKEDSLKLELIPDIANLMGYSQKRVAQKLYKSLFDVKTYTHLFITQITRDILPLDLNSAVKIDKDLFIIERKLYSQNPSPCNDTLSIIELVLRFNDKIDFYNITFVEYLKNSTFKDHYSLDQDNIKMIFYHDKLYELFRALYNAKILLKIFPPLLKVRNLPQFDGYHKYPVDLHSIMSLGELEKIGDEHIKGIYLSLNNDEKALLRVATFLHDCGKGRKKDHSILGANIVKKYLFELGFEKKLCNYGYLLVRYHTLMSNTATREDIYNEKVIYSFISKLREPIVLKLLYILTYADIESVDRGTYSIFNANLIKKLYKLSLEAFSNNAMISEATKRSSIEKKLQKSDEFKSLKKSTQKTILRIESNLLFFKYSIKEINSLAKWIEDIKNSHEYKITFNGYLSIEILSKDELNVGYLLGKLSYLDIVTMDIFKIRSQLKYFKIDFAKNIEKESLNIIQSTIKESFDMSIKTTLPPLSILRKEIDIDCHHSTSYARMKLNTKDQRGLIANVIALFDDMGIDIASAKIQTMKNRARNLFLIEKNGNFCDFKDIIVEKLTKKGR